MTKKTIDLTKKNFIKWLKAQPDDRSFKPKSASFCPLACYAKDKLNIANEDFDYLGVGFNQMSVYDISDKPLLKFDLPKWADDFYHELDAKYEDLNITYVNKNEVLPLLKTKSKLC